MKSKPTDQLQHPQEIIDTLLRAALKPHARALLDAAARDKQLESAMDVVHPTRIKEECAALLERACAGDTEADGVLRAAGGTEQYIQKRTSLFDLERARCRANAKADAPLWHKVSGAAVAALDAALVQIRGQWTAALEILGEDPRPSSWENKMTMMHRAIGNAAFNAEQLQHGTNWQVESLGLRGLLQ